MDNRKWTIGRADAGLANILISDSTVSAEHAFLYFINGAFYLQDNESTNGTFIERSGVKERIKAGEIFPSDRIYFGNELKRVDELIGFSNEVQVQQVEQKELVVIKQAVGYQSNKLQLFENNGSVSKASVNSKSVRPEQPKKSPKKKPAIVKQEKPKIKSDIVQKDSSKPVSTSSKQKCSECGMVITKDSKCPYCGHQQQ